ncbi:MAG: hypothetical protein HY863_17000 [Chloroflexi bacterium]|nr:hypothetical protein [Chloroflexota bacterium]
MKLLATKLQPPVLPKHFLSRPRLLGILSEVKNHKLSLLSAPTGYGKTSLVREWVSKTDLRIAWFTVDKRDNELNRFLAYISEAIWGILPEQDEHLVAPLPVQGTESVELYLTSLINQIAGFDGAVVLILNDYESIKSTECHAAVEFFVEYAPENLSLILLSRLDPPLPLARWRARGELLEIRTDVLRFSFNEISEFFVKFVGIEMTPEEIKVIEARTQGWAASLHLLSLSMHSLSYKERFFQALDDSLSHIIDFLADEVLSQLPDETRCFLYQISILNRFTGSLCNAVTKNSHSEDILRDLERHNLFIEHLDEDRRWYHFHPLFSECLRQRLQEDVSLSVVNLHQRASDWYASNEDPDNALEHAFRAEDIDRAARIMESYAVLWIDQGDYQTFIRWFNKIPRERLLRYPSLTAFYLCALVDGRNLNEFDSYIDLQKELQEHTKVREMIKAAQANACFLRGDYRKALQMTEKNLAKFQTSVPLSIEGLFAYSFNWIIQIGIYLYLNDLKGADKALIEAIPIYLQTGLNGFAIDALGGRARNKMKMGQLHHAEDILEQGLLLLRRWGYEDRKDRQRFPAAIRIYGPLSRLYYEQNRLKDSITMAQKALESSGSGGYVWGWRVVEVYSTLGLAHLALGNKKSALRTLNKIQQFEEVLTSYPISDMWTRQIALRQKMRLAFLLAKDEDSLHRRIEEWVYAYQAKGPKRDDEISVILAYYLSKESETEQASIIIDNLVSRAEIDERYGDLIEYLLLQPNYERVSRALALAEKQGYFRTFLDGGEAIQALLSGIETPYAEQLLENFPSESTSKKANQEDIWFNLSERRILNLLAKEYTNQKIAYELSYSINTVKWYARQIYKKLGVRNRRKAVKRVRELDIL